MKTKWVDVLDGKKVSYALLTKKNRVQVIASPTKKQLRTRGKRGWELVGTMENNSSLEELTQKITKVIFGE